LIYFLIQRRLSFLKTFLVYTILSVVAVYNHDLIKIVVVLLLFLLIPSDDL